MPTAKDPEALHRRRAQNRAAQRNHRHRLLNCLVNDDSNEGNRPGPTTINPGQLDSNAPASTSTDLIENPLEEWTFDFSSQEPTPSLNTLGEMNTDLSATQFLTQCDCSGILGPCEVHREAIRLQLLSSLTNSQTDFSQLIGQIKPAQTTPVSTARSTAAEIPNHFATNNLAQTNMNSGLISPQESRISDSRGSRRRTGLLLDEGANTACFKEMLSITQAAGFDSFDSLVLRYYTSKFEKNSIPDIAQRRSRGRNLHRVLKALHKSSMTWTTWEARGYREKIFEAAESIYVADFERLESSIRKKLKPNRSGENKFPPFSSASSSGSELPLTANKTYDEDNSTKATGNLATTLPISREGVRLPSLEMQRLYQNKLPNLWALLTELAGPNSMQCERAVLATIALLHNTRRSPDIDLYELILVLLEPSKGKDDAYIPDLPSDSRGEQ
ncbi:hypothetical protein MMC17_009450 [Xylographa soralifera]|nr:hypothetical protein [Xylographa soralifera]